MGACLILMGESSCEAIIIFREGLSFVGWIWLANNAKENIECAVDWENTVRALYSR